MKKYLVLLVALLLIAGLAMFGANEKTNASKSSSKHEKKQEETKSKLTFTDMTTDQYLGNYNKIKNELAGKNIEILPFKLELEKDTNYYRFYYPKEEKYIKGKAKWVSVMLKRDGKTLDGLMYNGAPDLNTIKAMIQATGVTWSEQLDQFIKEKGANQVSEEIQVDGVRISIKRNPGDINVMVDPIRLSPPKKL
ncbi:hypothetical protein P9597_27055 [Aneurinibacillus migulanus]|uniref:hypothetical protein n=1 Tax=Aneurinibacillus migulanus TaxID=47500 RepID=UPI002E1C3AEA|nr:hypothetical protein [Aneurinibacillus migulanus]